VLRGEAPVRWSRDATESPSSVRAAPDVVTNDKVALGDEAQDRPAGVGNSRHDAVDGVPKLLEPDLWFSLGLMVDDVSANQPLEVDRT
jgi:hypothetical protein